MNSRYYERLWNAVRSLKDRYRTFEGALSRQQAHALYRAAEALVDSERRLLSVYYQEQTRDRPAHDDVHDRNVEDLHKAVAGVASINDQVVAACFIAAESDISADERARKLLQHSIDEHRRIIRELVAIWDRAPRPRG